MDKLLDGTKLANRILSELKEEISTLERPPHLVGIQVGENKESELYIKTKSQKANDIGMIFTHLKFNEDVTEEKVISTINELNMNNDIDGIMVQMPLPKHIDPVLISQVIAPWKDIDGFHPLNKGLLDIDQAELISPTALGAYELMKEYNIDPKGKNVVVIGSGEIAGKPMAKIMLNMGATVTICNKNTKDISVFTKDADIVIAAVGHKELVKKEFVKDGVVMINIGLTKDDEGVHGDFDFDELEAKSSYITPIKGGTGPMTVALLLRNTLTCYKMK